MAVKRRKKTKTSAKKTAAKKTATRRGKPAKKRSGKTSVATRKIRRQTKLAAQKALARMAAREAAAKAAKLAKAARIKAAKVAASIKASKAAAKLKAIKAAARIKAAKAAAKLKAAKLAAQRRARAEKKAAKAAARKARKIAIRNAKAARLAAVKAAKAARRAALRARKAAQKAAAKAKLKAKKLAERAAAKAVREAERLAAKAAAKAAREAAKVPPVNPGIVLRGHLGPRYAEILSVEAIAFLGELHREFEGRRWELLAERVRKQKRYDKGAVPDFLPETAEIREREWQVAAIPADLQNRRVEITGPVDRKMIVNALNSGATHYMADFEDANSPTWANNIEGQLNLKDYWAGRIAFTDPESEKHYEVKDKHAVLIVRPRGWHLNEAHLEVDRREISASLFDFGLFVFHNAKAQIAQGTGPYFYLPKLESHEEARLWNDVFVFAQEKLGIPIGSIKATVLIETLPAAFEMDEILWELRDHIAGMNAGRWDYIFSFIKTFAKNPNYILPDRSQVVMGEAFLGAYAALLVQTCHKRGAFAMGGMAAQIPIKGDKEANAAAFDKVKADKEREVRDGYDGTWVAHPGLVPVAMEVFDRMLPEPNQVSRTRLHVRVLPTDLLKIHEGTRTDEGFRLNIRVGVQYIEAWLNGRGAVPIYNLMEDAATAEISRAQIWQWLKYGAELEGGIKVTRTYFEKAMHEEMARVKQEVGARAFNTGRFQEAEKLFRQLSVNPDFAPFLTIPAYELIA